MRDRRTVQQKRVAALRRAMKRAKRAKRKKVSS